MAAEALRATGKLRLRAFGSSMLPAIWPGDTLYIQRDAAAQAQPGDIVMFAREGRLFVHRVVEKREPLLVTRYSLLVTRGDRLTRNDAPVSAGELLGRVTAIERGGRRFAPRLSFWGRVVSWLLRRSELATRLVLRIKMAKGEEWDVARASRP